MFCILKNSFKVVLSSEHPKETQIEDLGRGGAMEGCICDVANRLQNVKMYIQVY